VARHTGPRGASFGAVTKGVLEQALVSLSGVTTVVIGGRVLGAAGLGQYVLGYSAISFAGAIHAALVGEPLLVFAPRSDLGKGYVAGSGICAIAFAAGTLLLGGGVSLCILLLGGGQSTSRIVAAASGAAAAFVTAEFRRRSLLAAGRIRGAIGLAVVSGVVRLGMIAGLAISSQLSPAGMLGAVALGYVVASLTSGAFSELGSVSEQEILRAARVNWRHGRWLLAEQGIGWSLTNASYWLLAAFGGVGAVGVLRSAQALLSPLLLAVAGVSNVAAPEGASVLRTIGIEQFRRYLNRLGLLLVAGSVVYVGLLIAQGGVALRLILGGAYAGYGWVLVWLGASALLSVPGQIARLGLRCLDRTYVLFVAYTIAGVTVSVGALFLAWALGLKGVLVAIVLSSLTTSFLMLRGLKAEFRTASSRMAAIEAR
jgi:O-antigen/teichoic acid export membrane protein